MKNKLVIALLAFLVITVSVLAFVLSDRDFVENKDFKNDITKIESVSTSDDLDSIEEDLLDTEIEDIDSELSSIELEINQ